MSRNKVSGTVRRTRLSMSPGAALTITRVGLESSKLVYVLVANKTVKVDGIASPIVYIGTTKRGYARVAESLVATAADVLREHGVTSLTARVVTCQARQRVKMWTEMERALIHAFKERHGKVPLFNTQGKNIDGYKTELFGKNGPGNLIARIEKEAKRK